MVRSQGAIKVPLGAEEILAVQVIDEASGMVVASAPGMTVAWTCDDPALHFTDVEGMEGMARAEAVGPAVPCPGTGRAGRRNPALRRSSDGAS